jgi:hypothetical protein
VGVRVRGPRWGRIIHIREEKIGRMGDDDRWVAG